MSILAESVAALSRGSRYCVYGGRLIVVSPNEQPYFIDLATGEKVEVDLGQGANLLHMEEVR